MGKLRNKFGEAGYCLYIDDMEIKKDWALQGNYGIIAFFENEQEAIIAKDEMEIDLGKNELFIEYIEEKF